MALLVVIVDLKSYISLDGFLFKGLPKMNGKYEAVKQVNTIV